MENEQTAFALLIFRVGPVLCCAPADPVQTIINPPKLTHPPGSNDARPGIFYHADHVVSVSELRHRFGVTESEREQPGRLIITLQGEAFVAYWVDEIIEVIDTPSEGWSEPSHHLPQGVFSKTLLLNEKIYLFADFAHFKNLPESGYLSQYIDKLGSGMSAAEIMAEVEVIEDEPSEQQTEASTSPTTENDSATLTKAPDTGENTAQVNGTDDSKDDRTSVQAATQQAGSTEEHDDSATPPLEPAAGLDSEKEDEKAVSSATNELELPFSSVTTPELAASDSLVQTKQNHNEDEPVATTETLEARPESIEPVPLEPDTPKPDPAESKQEPKKPSFPWQNLAAAIVLLLTIASIGIYYSWSSSNKSIKQQTKNSQPVMTQQLDVPQKKEMTATELLTDAQQNRSARQQDEKEYRAEIKPDDKGVTIVLHSPKNEPVFKPRKQVSTKKPVRQKKLIVRANKSTKKAKSGRQEIIHIVVKGDTLWAIAKRYVNNPYKYSRLARLSKIKNPDRIYPGDRVRILRYNNNAK